MIMTFNDVNGEGHRPRLIAHTDLMDTKGYKIEHLYLPLSQGFAEFAKSFTRKPRGQPQGHFLRLLFTGWLLGFGRASGQAKHKEC